jgi:hypothetical protein
MASHGSRRRKLDRRVRERLCDDGARQRKMLDYRP